MSFHISFRDGPDMNMRFREDSEFSIGFGEVKYVVENDYTKLTNKPRINGIELSGNQSAGDLHLVSENTTAGWDSDPQYLPKSGEICIYTDYAVLEDDMGRPVTYPGFKIGDGNSYLIDLPFVGTELRYLLLRRLQEHEENAEMHVTSAEKTFWNNKLNCSIANEELVFTRN